MCFFLNSCSTSCIADVLYMQVTPADIEFIKSSGNSGESMPASQTQQASTVDSSTAASTADTTAATATTTPGVAAVGDTADTAAAASAGAASGTAGSSSGHYSFTLVLPAAVQDVFLYCMYLRQALRSCELINLLHLAALQSEKEQLRRSPQYSSGAAHFTAAGTAAAPMQSLHERKPSRSSTPVPTAAAAAAATTTTASATSTAAAAAATAAAAADAADSRDFSKVHPAWLESAPPTLAATAAVAAAQQPDAALVSPVVFAASWASRIKHAVRRSASFSAEESSSAEVTRQQCPTAVLAPADLTFYYNLSRHMPAALLKLPFAKQIGNGIALIALQPLARSGAASWTLETPWPQLSVLDIPRCSSSSSSSGSSSELGLPPGLQLRFTEGSSSISNDSSSSNEAGVAVELHACGAVNLPHLVSLLKHCFSQALLDYYLERLLLHNSTAHAEHQQLQQQAASAAETAASAAAVVTQGALVRLQQQQQQLQSPQVQRVPVTQDLQQTVAALDGLLGTSAAAAVCAGPTMYRCTAAEFVPAWTLLAAVRDLAQGFAQLHAPLSERCTVLRGTASSTAASSTDDSIAAVSELLVFAQHKPGESVPALPPINSDSDSSSSYTVVLGLYADTTSSISGTAPSAAGAAVRDEASGVSSINSSSHSQASSVKVRTTGQQFGSGSGDAAASDSDRDVVLFPSTDACGTAVVAAGSSSSSSSSEREQAAAAALARARRRGMVVLLEVQCDKQTLVCYNAHPNFVQVSKHVNTIYAYL
jgi:hypothetical protein